MVKFDSQKAEYQLNIDSDYYNTLDIEGFSRMMKDPSYCYKFYWLEAIVQLIAEEKKEATLVKNKAKINTNKFIIILFSKKIR